MLRRCKKYAQNDITIMPYDTMDLEGQKSYKTAVPLKCLIAGKINVVKNVHGEDTVSMKTIYIDACLISDISCDDILNFEGSDHIPVTIDTVYNKGKKDLFVVYC